MKLVDARAIQDILTENVDENVSHFIAFTDHGTLLSHSATISKIDVTRFTAFAAIVWRNHESQAASTGNTHSGIGGIPAMNLVGFKIDNDKHTLQQLVVEMDGIISVVRLIAPRLLLATQSESDQGKNDKNDGASNASNADHDAHEDESDGTPDSNDSTGDIPDRAASIDTQKANTSSQSTHSGPEELVANHENATPDTRKPSKIRILMLKAEAMAECLADEYPATMPHDFY